MNLFRLITLTLWFLLSWITLAHAGPVVALFGAIGSFLASGSILAQLAFGLLVSGVRLVVSLLFGAEKTTQQAGIRQDVKFGGNNPLSFIMGYYATAGQLEYANTYGEINKTPNAFLTKVISLGDIPCQATGVWLDDTYAVLPEMTGSPPTPQGWPISGFTVDGQDYAWVQVLDGHQVTANTFLNTTFGSDPEIPWTSEMIGRGIPLIIITVRFRTELFGGPPAIIIETTGIPLYDPRKDSTVGGSGTQRWNDWSTWEPSNNLAVQAYNVLRGIRYGEETIWGGDYEAYELPLANWFIAMNECDVASPLKDGGTEPQYRSGIEVEVNEEPASILEELFKAGNARLGNSAGLTTLSIGAPSAPVYSFTDDHIIVTNQSMLDPFPGIDDTYNGASASYPEPLIKWGPKDAPQYLRTDLEILDNNQQRLADIQYRACPYPIQVQRNMRLAVEDYRRFKVHQLTLLPEARILTVNDVVAWTSNYNQYINKKFIVIEVRNESHLLPTFLLREIDPSDNSWNPEEDQKDYVIPPIGSIRPPVQIISGWQVFPHIISKGGKQIATIRVAFAGDLDDVQYVRIQVRFADTQELVFDGTVPYGQPTTDGSPKSVILNGTFLPDEDYEVRGILIPYSSDRFVDWSSWLPVHTDDVWLGDFYPIDLDRLAEDVQAMQKWLGDSIRDVQEELHAVAAEGAANSMVGFQDKQTLRRELVSTFENANATFTEMILAATGPNSALVLDITELKAVVYDPVTGVNANATAINSLSTRVTNAEGAIEVNSAAIIAVAASVDDNFADGTIRIEAGFTPSTGWLSRAGIMVRVGDGSTFNIAGMYFEATETEARIIVDSDQFIVMTNGQLTALFMDGTSYLNTALIGELTSNNIKAKSLDADQVLQNGSLITEIMAFNSVTDRYTLYQPQVSRNDAAALDQALQTAPTNNPNPNPVLMQYDLRANYTLSRIGSEYFSWELRRNGSPLLTISRTVTSNTSTGDLIISGFFIDDGPVQGMNTYTLHLVKPAGTNALAVVSGVVKMLWWKR